MGCDVEFLKYTLEREFQLPFAQLVSELFIDNLISL